MSNIIKLPSLKERVAAKMELNRREQITAIDESISAAWASLSMGPEMTKDVVAAIIKRLDDAPIKTIRQVPITSPLMKQLEDALEHIGGRVTKE